MAKKISDWTMTECGCGVFRYFEGSDPDFIPNRVAVIEKTPRVRIRPAWATSKDKDFLNWAEGDKGSGPSDMRSREWCDAVLKLFYGV